MPSADLDHLPAHLFAPLRDNDGVAGLEAVGQTAKRLHRILRTSGRRDHEDCQEPEQSNPR